LGKAQITVFLGEKAGEMLADNLVGGIAFETLRPAVPGHHPACGIEHIDGIIGYGVDELLECLCRGLLLGFEWRQ
jgi:hypothetical protein